MKWGALLAFTTAIAAAPQRDEVRVSAHAYSQPQLHLTAQTNLVQLEVVVRDPRGRAVTGLKQSDFEVLDEGKPSEIAAFSMMSRDEKPAGTATPDSPIPSPFEAVVVGRPPEPPRRSTLLFFDDLHGTAIELQRTKLAARGFIKEGLGAGGRAAVFGSSEGLTLDFTSDADALAVAIEKLRSHQRYSENGITPCPRITPYQAFLIVHNDFDALNAALQELTLCNSTDPSQVTPAVRGRNPGLASVSKTNPLVETVRSQASQTWQQVRDESLNSFDAIESALTRLEHAPGSRVLLVVSTGFLSGLMDKQRTDVIDHAIRAGIVINAIDAKGLWSEAPSRPFDQALETASLPNQTFNFETSTIASRNFAMDEAMQEFASGTGGLFFHNNNDLSAGFAQLAAIPQTVYLLAIRPDSEAAGKYRKLKVRLTAKSNGYVQTRPGYFTPANPVAGDMTAEWRPLDRALTGSDIQTAIPVQVTALPGTGGKGETIVSTLIHVDIAPLKFAQRADRHMQKLSFIGALLDPSGKMVAAKEGAMELALKDDTLARLTGSGMNAGLTFAAPPGAYKLRVVVQDAEGKIATQNLAVEVPK
ncbi:MAG: VWA domain-containing protein [Ignavibacteriota bacterium]